MTGRASRAVSVITQYGVRTPTNGTVLVVSTDRAVAEDALAWIQDGQIVARTLAVSAWQPSIDARAADTTHGTEHHSARFDRTG